MSSDAVIDIRGLTKDYGPNRALNDVSFSVNRGEIFGYVGPNGAGKTTTIKIITGLLHPSWGDAFICGHSILHDPLSAKAKIGYLPESGALFEKLTASEYLTATGQLYRIPQKDLKVKVGQWLEYFGLAERAGQAIGLLSKGNKQKICWIATLLHDPEVLILDEPLNGLDVEAISRIKEMMSSLAAQGRTIFYSSHLMDVVEKVCTRIAVLQRGQLICLGTAEQIRNHFSADNLEEALLRMWQVPGHV